MSLMIHRQPTMMEYSAEQWMHWVALAMDDAVAGTAGFAYRWSIWAVLRRSLPREERHVGRNNEQSVDGNGMKGVMELQHVVSRSWHTPRCVG